MIDSFKSLPVGRLFEVSVKTKKMTSSVCLGMKKRFPPCACTSHDDEGKLCKVASSFAFKMNLLLQNLF